MNLDANAPNSVVTQTFPELINAREVLVKGAFVSLIVPKESFGTRIGFSGGTNSNYNVTGFLMVEEDGKVSYGFYERGTLTNNVSITNVYYRT